MLARAREALLRRRGVAATLAVLATLAAAAGMQHLSFTTDYRAFFSEDNPDLAQLEFIEANFARGRPSRSHRATAARRSRRRTR